MVLQLPMPKVEMIFFESFLSEISFFPKSFEFVLLSNMKSQMFQSLFEIFRFFRWSVYIQRIR